MTAAVSPTHGMLRQAGDLHAAGRNAEALGLLDQAQRVSPRDWRLAEARGHVLLKLERHEAAADAFRTALRVGPANAAAHYNLGCALLAAGRHAAAAASFRAAIRQDASHRGAHNNLGNALRYLGRPAEAVEAFSAALRLDPGRPELLFNLARVQLADDRCEAALETLDALLAKMPGHASALALRAQALSGFRRPEEAGAALQALVRLRPDDPVPAADLANVLRAHGRFAEAEAALAQAPAGAAVEASRACLLAATGRYNAALEAFDRAVALDPAEDDLHFGRGEVLLTMGRFAEGWQGYARRPSARGVMARSDRPAWDGSAAPRRRLLVLDEQGFGDSIQMCRYVPLAAARTAGVTLEARAPLRRLMRSLAGAPTLVDPTATPRHDLACALMDLPRLFATTLETIPADVPYLHADPAAVAAWQARLAPLPRPRVGIAWAGGRAYLQDVTRSLDPALLAPLASVAASFVSLQKPAAAVAPKLPLADWTAELADFADTAALIEALDLVISVDTAVAHLAGALGRPVWLLNRFDTAWRWLLDRTDSPWYPTMRIFRQPAPGDWPAVIAAVAAALEAVAP